MNFKKKIIFFLAVVLIPSMSGFSQHYNFKNYNTKSGMIGSNVNGIYQDRIGYIWFAIQGGISRFDGKNFKNFTKKEGLIGNDVTCINGDQDGNIWIATTEGLSEYNGVKFKNYTTKDGLGDNFIHTIFIDNKNILWFATDMGGVSYFDGKVFKKITKSNGLLSNTIFDITQDKKGDFWFATNAGISNYNGTEVINYSDQKNIADKEFYSMLTDSEGSVWFAGEVGNGIIKYTNSNTSNYCNTCDTSNSENTSHTNNTSSTRNTGNTGNTGKFEKLTLPIQLSPQNRIFKITEDSHGNIWFATDNDGLIKYNKKNFYLYNEYNGLSSNQVYSIANDYEGNLWFGSTNGGADKLNSESFTTYTEKHGLSANKIASFYKNNDLIIAGTQGKGIDIFNGSISNVKQQIKELADEKIFSIAENNNNEIWIGTEKSGIYILEKIGDVYKIKKHISKLLDKTLEVVDKILFDHNGTVWISTFGNGAFSIKNNEIKNYSIANGFPSDNLLTIKEDSKGNIWFGTIDAGAIKYDGKKIYQINEINGLANNAVWSIAEDNLQRIFLGTGEGGIACVTDKKIIKIDVSNGLCSNFIETLIWDDIGKCLWAGTNNGVNKLEIGADYKVQSLRYYSESEGFNGEEVTSCFQDKEGLIWFGTINGLCLYNRKFDFQNKVAPKIIFADILLGYKKVDWKNYSTFVDERTNIPKSLTLSYKNNHLTFNFKALTTDNIKYSFILLGQDTEWSPLSSITEANFSNIVPGKTYRFKVKAINSLGVWCDKAIEFDFTITLPWWQTWWFYLICILSIIVCIYLFIKYRTRKLAIEKQQLEGKVEERTFELSLAFKEIKDSINYAKIIQDSILPLNSEIQNELPDSFVFYKPRDIVSGDFYWFHKNDNKTYFAVVDCTGHGVPGAFMSMIGSSLLTEILNESKNPKAADILTKLHCRVRKALKQDRDSVESHDGMELSLIIIDKNKMELNYAGARRPLYYFNMIENEFKFSEIKADKYPIGGNYNENVLDFTDHFISIQKGDTFYMFTDGYIDQFDRKNEKKFSSKKFKETLAQIQNLTMEEQHGELSTVLENWKGDCEQVDDILAIGIKI